MLVDNATAGTESGDRIVVHAPAADIDIVNQSVDDKTAARPIEAEDIADLILQIGITFVQIQHMRSLKTIDPRR